MHDDTSETCSKCEEKFIRRLAAKFEAGGNSSEPLLDTMDVGTWLDLDEEEVQQLVDLDLLATTKATSRGSWERKGVHVSEVLRFLEANPWWLEQRAQSRLAKLRRLVVDDARRAAAIAARRDDAPADLADKPNLELLAS